MQDKCFTTCLQQPNCKEAKRKKRLSFGGVVRGAGSADPVIADEQKGTNQLPTIPYSCLFLCCCEEIQQRQAAQKAMMDKLEQEEKLRKLKEDKVRLEAEAEKKRIEDEARAKAEDSLLFRACAPLSSDVMRVEPCKESCRQSTLDALCSKCVWPHLVKRVRGTSCGCRCQGRRSQWRSCFAPRLPGKAKASASL